MQQNSKPNNITFSQRYDIRYELGAGAVGVVYKARDKLLDKDVAIKLLKYKGKAGRIVRFQQEARVCARLAHKNILTALDFGATEDGDPYLVLDFIEGKTLYALLQEEKRLPIATALPLILELSSAMVYAHKHGVLHRDLKPSNMMTLVDDHGQLTLKVMDFGLAKLSIEDETKEHQKLTTTGGYGSPPYMSPEQARGESVDERSDIYSFGCTAFETLTGQPPILGETALNTLQKKQSETAPALKQVYGEGAFPEELERIVAKCLALQKADRYKSFNDLRDDLLSFIDSGAIEVDETIAAIKSEASAQKTSNKIKLRSAAALIVGVLALSAFLLNNTKKSPEPRPFQFGHDVDRDHSLSVDFEITSEHTTANLILIRYVNAEWIKGHANESYMNHSDLKILNSEIQRDALKPLTRFQFTLADVENCTIDDTTAIHLSKFPYLQKLFILSNYQNFTEAGFRSLAKAPLLDKLTVQQDLISDGDLEALSHMKRLIDLSVEGKGFTPQGLAKLSNLPNLRSLDVGTPSDACIDGIASMKRLQKVGLIHLKPGQLKGKLKLLATMPNLTTLHLNRTNLADDDLRYLPDLKKLDLLILDTVRMKSDGPINDICRHRGITWISLQDMGSLSVSQIVRLAEKPGLNKFVMNGAYDERAKIDQILSRSRPDLKIKTDRVL